MASLSQAEIDALLKNAPDKQPRNGNPGSLGGDGAAEEQTEDISKYFNAGEIDLLGEAGNICIGTSATTMSALVGRRVTITTPTVELYKVENVLASYKCPFLAIDVEYTRGLMGKNLLILKDYDAALIADLMMGGEGVVNEDNIELNEIHLSAMSEVMNQMIGSSATAMSNMMGDSVNISPPQIFRMQADENIEKYLGGVSPILRISFDMEIEGRLKSKLIQIMPISVAKELIDSLMYTDDERDDQAPEQNKKNIAEVQTQMPGARKGQSTELRDRQQVKVVKPAGYQSFDEPAEFSSNQGTRKSNFDLINDIPLQVTVELGKAVKNLSEVLNFGTGSIIVLDKQAGDLVDVIVNGKRIAKGEVVVIDENYGVRITEILKT